MFFRPLTALGLVTLVTAAAFSCGNPRAPGDAQHSIEEVLEAVRAYNVAWEQKDGTAVRRVLAEEYRYFSSRGVVRSREWFLAFHASPEHVLVSSVRDELDVALHGNTAVVSSRWRGSGTYEGEPFDDDQRCTLTWVFDDGAWRLLAEQCTNIVN
jgi:ketosteroid isomerase-like protein